MAKIIDIRTRQEISPYTPDVHTVIMNCRRGWFRDEFDRWPPTGIYEENGRYWRYQYFFGEYHIYEVAAADVKWTWDDDEAQLQQAFDDWMSSRAYVDNRGNYRVRAERGRGGKIAKWNKAIKARFGSVSAFHDAAQKGLKHGCL